jgi:nickel-dependent lactate racemase
MNTNRIGISLPYGDGALELELPVQNVIAVASPRDVCAQADCSTLVSEALRHPIESAPLSTLVEEGQRLLILVDDNTRPTPVAELLPALFAELEVERKRLEVTILIALGTHRAMTPDEIVAKVGADIAAQYPIVNHDWTSPDLVDLGTTPSGTPIRANRLIVDTDVCIGIGNIVPHNIAGWSGGGKIVQPGICGGDTTNATHLLAARCPSSNLGKVLNPVRSEIEAVAKRTKMRHVVNTILDRHGTLVHVVAGETQATYLHGVELARGIWEIPIPRLADIVLVSSHPADIDFWQANKGLYAAERIVKRGGDIILVTPCPEGISSQREHVEAIAALHGLPSRELYHAAVRTGIRDYAALALSDTCARCTELAWVTVVSDGLTKEHVEILSLESAASAEAALANALRRQGPDASIVVLTHGGESLPVITGS